MSIIGHPSFVFNFDLTSPVALSAEWTKSTKDLSSLSEETQVQRGQERSPKSHRETIPGLAVFLHFCGS